MRRELVFTAHPGAATAARPVTLAQAGLKERSDLQEWIRANPHILGPGVRIVTYEFDRWASFGGSHGDRLDLLGLDEDGRLVLAELKRDGAPETVEMQAIKYAAFASKFSPETLAACHGQYLRRTLGDDTISDDDALARLDEHCGGLDEEQLASPRIVLVAGSFPESVTAAVVWLCNQGLDITLVQVGAYQCDHDLVITVSQLWPLPELDEFTVSPVAPAVKPTPGKRKRNPLTAVAALAASGAITDGTELRLVPSGSHAAAVKAWVDQNPDRGRAIWRTGQKIKALEWAVDSGSYSASGLAEHIIKQATGADTSVPGSEWWALDDGTTLAELAGISPSAGTKDWSSLHALLPKVSKGEWTTYGDLAAVIDSHPIAVGSHVARCPDCPNGWRVLGVDGRPRPNFAWADPDETRSCRQVLESEGVTFTDAGKADQAQRVTEQQLKERLHGVPAQPAAPSDGT